MAVSDRNDSTRGPQLALWSAQGQVGAACSTTGLGLVCGLTSGVRRATQRPERPKSAFLGGATALGRGQSIRQLAPQYQAPHFT